MFKHKLHITRHAVDRSDYRGVDLDAASRETEHIKELFGLDTLPDGEYDGRNGRVVVRNGAIVTVTEARRRGLFCSD